MVHIKTNEKGCTSFGDDAFRIDGANAVALVVRGGGLLQLLHIQFFQVAKKCIQQFPFCTNAISFALHSSNACCVSMLELDLPRKNCASLTVQDGDEHVQTATLWRRHIMQRRPGPRPFW